MDTIVISGVIAPSSDTLVKEDKTFSSDLLVDFLKTAPEKIFVEIESDGGNVNEGIAIYDLLKNSGKHVTTIGEKINSIACVIFLAGDSRIAYKNIKAHIHSAWIDPQRLLGIQLNAEILNELQNEAEACDQKILDLYTDVLGKGKEKELLALMTEQTPVSAGRLLELGFATEVIEHEYQSQNKVLTFSNNFFNLITDEKMNTEKIIS